MHDAKHSWTPVSKDIQFWLPSLPSCSHSKLSIQCGTDGKHWAEPRRSPIIFHGVSFQPDLSKTVRPSLHHFSIHSLLLTRPHRSLSVMWKPSPTSCSTKVEMASSWPGHPLHSPAWPSKPNNLGHQVDKNERSAGKDGNQKESTTPGLQLLCAPKTLLKATQIYHEAMETAEFTRIVVVFMASYGSTSVCSLYFCACSWQRMLLYSSSWLCRTGILLSAISFSWLEENNVDRNVSFTPLKTVKRNCYWKQTIKAIRKWQKTHRKLNSEPREKPCGMTLWIKDIIWQCCKSTAYVEIRPYGCSCSHLLPANKCEHSHSHWWESPNFHPVHSNLFYLQIFTTSWPSQTRFTVWKYSYVLPAPPQMGAQLLDHLCPSHFWG